MSEGQLALPLIVPPGWAEIMGRACTVSLKSFRRGKGSSSCENENYIIDFFVWDEFQTDVLSVVSREMN